jgi:predicted alpha/beta superfamily hydrolase
MFRQIHTATLVLLCLVCVATDTAICADAGDFEVTFRMKSSDLPEDAAVFITGSVPELGNWRPSQVPMKYLADHVWSISIRIKGKQTIQYKYTLGSWAQEGAQADGRPLKNLSVSVDKSMSKNDRIDFWTDRTPRPVGGKITGQVKYHRGLTDGDLRPRDAIVWLPPGYDASGEQRYPVLYMHDGQNMVDPQTSAFGVDWQIDESCTRLIKESEISPLIIIGIYNTPDRSEEYLPGPTGEAYMNFVAKSLKPMIDREYRTNPNRSHCYTGGSSAGGLCAFMLVWEHSDVFSKAICMSPAFKYQKPDGSVAFDYVSTLESSDVPRERIFLYVDNGGVGLDEKLQSGTTEMIEALNEKGLTAEHDYHWKRHPNDRHTESAWAKRFPEAIKILDASD